MVMRIVASSPICCSRGLPPSLNLVLALDEWLPVALSELDLLPLLLALLAEVVRGPLLVLFSEVS